MTAESPFTYRFEPGSRTDAPPLLLLHGRERSPEARSHDLARIRVAVASRPRSPGHLAQRAPRSTDPGTPRHRYPLPRVHS